MAHQTVVVLLLILAAAATAVEEKNSKCPHGWSYFGGRCFLYQATAVTWAEAEKECLNHGGHLVSIHSADEYSYVRTLVRRYDPNESLTWIGLTDCQMAFTWFWSDGTQVDLTLWDHRQPDNTGNYERCAHMNRGESKKWNDVSCDDEYPFVCAKRSA